MRIRFPCFLCPAVAVFPFRKNIQSRPIRKLRLVQHIRMWPARIFGIKTQRVLHFKNSISRITSHAPAQNNAIRILAPQCSSEINIPQQGRIHGCRDTTNFSPFDKAQAICIFNNSNSRIIYIGRSFLHFIRRSLIQDIRAIRICHLEIAHYATGTWFSMNRNIRINIGNLYWPHDLPRDSANAISRLEIRILNSQISHNCRFSSISAVFISKFRKQALFAPQARNLVAVTFKRPGKTQREPPRIIRLR